MRSKIKRARTPSHLLGGRTSGRMRFGLAVFGAVLIGGIGVGLAVLGGSTGNTKSSQLHVRRAVAAGVPVSQTSRSSSSAVPTVQVAHGVLTPAVRSMKPAAGHWNMMFKKVGEHSRDESLKTSDRHQGSALVQRSAPKNNMPSPNANFEGVNNSCGCSPPDTEGDIGPNHYMQWVNLSFRVFNRDGTPAGSVTPGYQLFAGTPHCGAASGNGGDPIVLYDQFAHRWLASQLAYPNYPNPGPYYQCVAFSSTDNPTGTWCAYEFVALQSKLNDYPKFGVWPTQHAYMFTANQFSEP